MGPRWVKCDMFCCWPHASSLMGSAHYARPMLQYSKTVGHTQKTLENFDPAPNFKMLNSFLLKVGFWVSAFLQGWSIRGILSYSEMAVIDTGKVDLVRLYIYTYSIKIIIILRRRILLDFSWNEHVWVYVCDYKPLIIAKQTTFDFPPKTLWCKKEEKISKLMKMIGSQQW